MLLKDTEFFKVADPTALTRADLARWCEELAQFIRENPEDGDGLRARVKELAPMLYSAAGLMTNAANTTTIQKEPE